MEFQTMADNILRSNRKMLGGDVVGSLGYVVANIVIYLQKGSSVDKHS
jgi:hypothetical protein